MNWAGELGITLLPLNHSQKSIAFPLVGELLNVVPVSEAESLGSPLGPCKLLKPGATELWHG